MNNKQQALAVTVEEIRNSVSANQNKNGELEQRLGGVQARSLEVTKIIERNSIETQELITRLGTLEGKVVNLEDKLSSQSVQWPKLGDKDVRNSRYSTVDTLRSPVQEMGPHTVISEIYERRTGKIMWSCTEYQNQP